MSKLLEGRMHDGSRNFALLPKRRSSLRVLLHVVSLWGAVPMAYLPSAIAGTWIDFRYRGQRFSINSQYGDYWFFVKDASCPEPILGAVVAHFELLLRGRSREAQD